MADRKTYVLPRWQFRYVGTPDEIEQLVVDMLTTMGPASRHSVLDRFCSVCGEMVCTCSGDPCTYSGESLGEG